VVGEPPFGNVVELYVLVCLAFCTIASKVAAVIRNACPVPPPIRSTAVAVG